MSEYGEIGGFIEIERSNGTEYYPELVAVNSARNALKYIIEAKKIRKLYIPCLLCGCVLQTCISCGCGYELYNVDMSFRPLLDKQPGVDEYVYIVNYYGQIDNCELLSLKDRYGRVIFDNVQAFFQPPVNGIDTVYSCRKFFGVPDGGYAATDAMIDGQLEEDRSAGRMEHLLGRFECTASEYYSCFLKSEEEFDTMELRSMSPLTHNMLRAVDYGYVQQKRTRNFSYVASRLGRLNGLNIVSPTGAYCYPFLATGGQEIRKRMAAEKIYIPTLWRDALELSAVSDDERRLATDVLPLPCDQRYGCGELERMCSLLLECI